MENKTGKERILKSMGLIKEKPALTVDELQRAELDNLIEAFGMGCNTLDLSLTQMVAVASKFSPKKRQAIGEGLGKMFDLLESHIEEARSILRFERGSDSYRC